MNFYKLTIDDTKKYTYAIPTFGYPTKTIKCPICNRKWNSFENLVKYNLSYPVTFVNNNFADFIYCEACIMVSKRVKKIIENERICSPTFVQMPVIPRNDIPEEVLKKHSDMGCDVDEFLNENVVYFKMSADVGANLHSDSNVVWIDSEESVCQYCGYGIGYQQKKPFLPYYIELTSWNKQDLFRVKEFGWALFCTEKFKKLCEEQHFVGVKFKRVCVL